MEEWVCVGLDLWKVAVTDKELGISSLQNLTMNEKQNKSIITRSESYDVVTSRLCASEPCINFFGEETGNNNIEKRIYSVEEDIDNRRSTPTVAEYRHMNNRNIKKQKNQV